MRFPSPEPPLRNDDQLIPLVNVVLLMLIFFMVMGEITPAEAFRVAPPESRQPGDLERLPLELSVSGQGALALQGVPLLRSELEQKLNALSVGQAAGTVREIRIKADRDLKAGSLTALLEQLRDAGFTRVQLVTQIAGR